MPEVLKNETTNAVLKATIDGLAKLTDTQLGYVNETLKDIKSSLSSFATKNELEEVKKDFTDSVKRIEDAFVKHNADDEKSFGILAEGQKETEIAIIKWGTKWGTITAIALIVLSFLSPVIIDFFKNISSG